MKKRPSKVPSSGAWTMIARQARVQARYREQGWPLAGQPLFVSAHASPVSETRLIGRASGRGTPKGAKPGLHQPVWCGYRRALLPRAKIIFLSQKPAPRPTAAHRYTSGAPSPPDMSPTAPLTRSLMVNGCVPGECPAPPSLPANRAAIHRRRKALKAWEREQQACDRRDMR